MTLIYIYSAQYIKRETIPKLVCDFEDVLFNGPVSVLCSNFRRFFCFDLWIIKISRIWVKLSLFQVFTRIQKDRNINKYLFSSPGLKGIDLRAITDMGVKGLLPQLKEVQEALSLKRFRGKTLAIDSYAWLHRSVISCSWELAQDLETTKYISFFKKKVMMLRHFGIEPYFVFDGDNFESKTDTEQEREENRLKNKEKGIETLKTGNHKLAAEYFMKSVDVTPSMAKAVIDYLRSENIKYVVAPYEADPQMVYLEKLGLVDGIISEDSDLLIFGAKCLLTKLNDFGECIQISRENFRKCKAVPIGLMNDSQLRMVACLSGCDYTNGIPGIGIVKAFRLVKRHSNLSKCVLSLRLEGKIPVPPDFELEYKKADISFQYQRVFNPINNEISTLNELPPQAQIDETLLLECIGKLHENSIHHQIAMGEIDPISKGPLKSREDIVRSQSFASSYPAVSTPSEKERIAKRSYSTPVTSGLKRIDSFFKSSQNQSVKRSTTVPSKPEIKPGIRVLTPKSLSPTSKRRKMFNTALASTVQTPSSSKFFPSKATSVVPHSQLQATSDLSNISSATNTVPTQQEFLESQLQTPSIPTKTSRTVPGFSSVGTETKDNSVLEDLNSSDFNLTDPDDELDEVGTNIANERANKLYDDNKTGSLGSHKDIAKGLYEKFGFSSNKSPILSTQECQLKVPITESGKIPLKPTQRNNLIKPKPKTTMVKTKRTISRNLTLDTFIYKGA